MESEKKRETAHLVMTGFEWGMAMLACDKCGAEILIKEEFIERHNFCFCCGRRFVIDDELDETE